MHAASTISGPKLFHSVFVNGRTVISRVNAVQGHKYSRKYSIYIFQDSDVLYAVKVYVFSSHSIDLFIMSTTASLSQKHQNQTEKQQGPYIPADEPPATYESLDTGVPVNYANPNFVSTNHTTYAYISEPPGKVEVGGSAEKTFSLGKDAPHTAAVPKVK